MIVQEDPRKTHRTGSLRLQSLTDTPGMMHRPSSNEDLLLNLGPLPVCMTNKLSSLQSNFEFIVR